MNAETPQNDCGADLLPEKGREPRQTGKVLVLHGIGFGSDNLVWVFLNEEGLSCLAPGDFSKIPPCQRTGKI